MYVTNKCIVESRRPSQSIIKCGVSDDNAVGLSIDQVDKTLSDILYIRVQGHFVYIDT